MSQKDPVIERIGEHEYSMRPLPPRQSLHLLTSVTKMVGPAVGDVIGAMANGANADVLEIDIGAEVLSKAVSRLFEDLDSHVLDAVIDEFKKVSEVDGKPLAPMFDVHFLGELDQMIRWVGWGMGVQWGKSLRALAKDAVGVAAAAKARSKSPSPSTSTGSSGDQS